MKTQSGTKVIFVGGESAREVQDIKFHRLISLLDELSRRSDKVSRQAIDLKSQLSLEYRSQSANGRHSTKVHDILVNYGDKIIPLYIHSTGRSPYHF